MNDEWPPRMTMTPRRAAGLFLMAHCGNAATIAQDKLEELLKMFFDAGRNYEREQMSDKSETDDG